MSLKIFGDFVHCSEMAFVQPSVILFPFVSFFQSYMSFFFIILFHFLICSFCSAILLFRVYSSSVRKLSCSHCNTGGLILSNRTLFVCFHFRRTDQRTEQKQWSENQWLRHGSNNMVLFASGKHCSDRGVIDLRNVHSNSLQPCTRLN